MYNEGKKAFDAAADVVAHRLLTMNSTGEVLHSDGAAAAVIVGTSEYGAAAGETVGVRLINCPGTFEMTAAGAIGRGEPVYGAADGKVQALPAAPGDYRRIGIAMEEATSDGDIIEVLPDDHISVTTVA